MSNTVWVLVAEDDVYARDLMVMMLTRDWRTRVVAEVDNEKSIAEVLQDPTKRADVILLDTELPQNREWLASSLISGRNDVPPLLYVGTRVSETVLAAAAHPPCCGYLLKQEVQYGLAEAVWRAAQGQWLTTPTIRQAARQARLTLPAQTVILDGTVPSAEFTTREREIARLALIFGLSRREIADELQYQNPGEVGNLVARAYRKLDLTDLIQGRSAPELYFPEGKVLDHFRRAQQQLSAGKAIRDKATMAYHVMTIPDVEELY